MCYRREISCTNWTWMMPTSAFHCIKTLRDQFCLHVRGKHMPLFWSWLTVKHIYKINESTNGHLEKIDYSNSMIWYLYDTLIIGQTRGETLIAWISVIFLLQHLDFLLKLKKKSVLEPTQEIELLGLVSNSVNITLFFIKK